MHRCLKIAVKPSREIRWLCFNAGKLFNCANYLIKTGSAKPNIYDLYNKLSSNFFKLNLHSQTTTKIFSHVVRGWLNFFDYIKNPHKYPHPVKPPKFKSKKNCFHIVSFPRKDIKIDGSTITLCYPKNHRTGKGRRKKSDLNFININTNLDLSQLDISEVNIVPKYGKFFELQIIYKKKKNCKRKDKDRKGRREEEKAKNDIDAQSLNHSYVLDSNINKEEGEKNFVFRKVRKMALDPGVSNFFSVVIEGVKKGFLIDGKIWKSLTTFRLKKISELKSRLDSILNKAKKMAKDSLIFLFPAPYFLVHRLEEKIFRLWYKIAKVNEDFAHRVAKHILALALKYNVKEIVIGDGFRNKNKPSGMRDIANQLWHLAPHGKVVEYLKYLCSEHKIKVKVKDERYSSGVDSTGCAVPKTKTTKTRRGMIKKEYTPERRISRGLYKSSCGIVNADINAARNIGGIRGKEGLREVERVYVYQKKRGNKGIVEREGKGSESKSKGSPVERVEAVAVAGGSKVCMSQKLIANKPSPNPF
jgi:putative transposase